MSPMDGDPKCAGTCASDEELVDAAMNRSPQPERHMVTMPAEVREAVRGIPDFPRRKDILDKYGWERNEGARIDDSMCARLNIVLAWARKCAEDQK